MGHIFISYSRSDSSPVDILIKQLEDAGLVLWVDRGGIKAGDQWRATIVKAIEQADAILVILSENSIYSDNVRKEIDLAEAARVPLVPVALSDVQLPPTLKYQMVGQQILRLKSREEEKALIQALKGLSKQDVDPNSVKSDGFDYSEFFKTESRGTSRQKTHSGASPGQATSTFTAKQKKTSAPQRLSVNQQGVQKAGSSQPAAKISKIVAIIAWVILFLWFGLGIVNAAIVGYEFDESFWGRGMLMIGAVVVVVNLFYLFRSSRGQ